MNKSTYGEDLLAAYLTTHGIAFDREPKLPGISQLVDFVIDHPIHGKILLEVKDIVNFEYLAMRKYIDTDDGRTSYARAQDIYSEAAGLPDDIEAKEIGLRRLPDFSVYWRAPQFAWC